MFRAFVWAKERRREEFERDTAHAYQVVRIWVETKAKKRMPKFETLIGRRTGPQSTNAMRGVLEVLSAQYGYPVKAGRRKRG